MSTTLERLSDELETMKRERAEIERERGELERMKSEASDLERRREQLRDEISRLEGQATVLKLPDRETALLAAAESGVVATVEIVHRNRVYPHFLRARGWRQTSTGWTHDKLCPGSLVVNAAVKLQVDHDQKPLRAIFEAGFKKEHDRRLGLNQGTK
jgi:hypothetical protein